MLDNATAPFDVQDWIWSYHTQDSGIQLRKVGFKQCGKDMTRKSMIHQAKFAKKHQMSCTFRLQMGTLYLNTVTSQLTCSSKKDISRFIRIRMPVE